jgi:hypothetical protein
MHCRTAAFAERYTVRQTALWPVTTQQTATQCDRQLYGQSPHSRQLHSRTDSFMASHHTADSYTVRQTALWPVTTQQTATQSDRQLYGQSPHSRQLRSRTDSCTQLPGCMPCVALSVLRAAVRRPCTFTTVESNASQRAQRGIHSALYWVG